MTSDFSIKKQKVTYECPRFKVEETVYETDNQSRKTYTIRPSGDMLIVIPRMRDKLLMVDSTTPPLASRQWIFPIGFVTPGVAVADTAQDILLQNSGTVAQRFIYIGKFFPSKYMNAIVHVMIGEGLSRHLEHRETFREKARLFSEKDIADLLMDRTLGDGLALASYVYYVTSEHYWTEVHDGARNSNRSKQARR